MSDLSAAFEIVKNGLTKIGADAGEALLHMGDDARDDAEDALREYKSIVAPILTTYRDTPKMALSALKSAQLGFASKLAGLANERVRTTFDSILGDGLKSLTSLLGGALAVFG